VTTGSYGNGESGMSTQEQAEEIERLREALRKIELYAATALPEYTSLYEITVMAAKARRGGANKQFETLLAIAML